MPVHHVAMHPIRARGFAGLHFLAHAGEIAGKHGRGDNDGSRIHNQNV